MSQADVESVDWAGLLETAIATSPASHLAVVRCVAVGTVIEVTFNGIHDMKSELFGVRVPIPRAIGDDWWKAAVGPNPHDPGSTAQPEDWARLMAIAEVLAPYDMMNPLAPPQPDAHGVRWLYQFG